MSNCNLKTIFNVVLEVILLSLSALITAIAVQFFFKQHTLTPGGITGLSIVISSFFHLPIYYVSLSISVPLLIISNFVIGNKFAAKTIFITLMIPFFLKLVPVVVITNNTILAAILGGILVGFSIAIALKLNCATGGSDTIAILLHKIFKKIAVPNLILMIDSSIVLSSLLISKEWLSIVYSAFALLVIILTIKISLKLLKYNPQI